MDTPNAELAAWLRLTLTPGVTPALQRALLAEFGLPHHIFDCSIAQLVPVVGTEAATALLATDALTTVEAALAWAALPGNQILSLADRDYPSALLDIADPPTVLYVKGRVDLLARPAVAIVGARSATGGGEKNAEDFGLTLSESGLTVVSGLALGIDAAAHRGGLRGLGSTVAVIGTGADRIYPSRNRELAHRIASEGTIVSEFPLGTPAIAYNFPRRNRLIAGLVRGVLVVEAAERSGSLITARFAGEHGRDVFAIPGSIHSPLAKGCHRLIKDGAKLVESAQDVMEELRWLAPPPPRVPKKEKKKPGPKNAGAEPKGSLETVPAELSDADPFLAQLGFDPVDIETLSLRTQLDPVALYERLLPLELAGQVVRLPGSRFQRIA